MFWPIQVAVKQQTTTYNSGGSVELKQTPFLELCAMGSRQIAIFPFTIVRKIKRTPLMWMAAWDADLNNRWRQAFLRRTVFTITLKLHLAGNVTKGKRQGIVDRIHGLASEFSF